MSSRRRKRGFTLIEILVGVGITTIGLGIVLPAVQMVRANARLTQCKNNLHHLGTALKLFETQGRGKPSLDNWETDLLLTLDAPKVILACPERGTDESEGDVFSYAMSSKTPRMLGDDDGKIILVESNDRIINFYTDNYEQYSISGVPVVRHSDKLNALYYGGHVRTVYPAEIDPNVITLLARSWLPYLDAGNTTTDPE